MLAVSHHCLTHASSNARNEIEGEAVAVQRRELMQVLIGRTTDEGEHGATQFALHGNYAAEALELALRVGPDGLPTKGEL